MFALAYIYIIFSFNSLLDQLQSRWTVSWQPLKLYARRLKLGKYFHQPLANIMPIVDKRTMILQRMLALILVLIEFCELEGREWNWVMSQESKWIPISERFCCSNQLPCTSHFYQLLLSDKEWQQSNQIERSRSECSPRWCCDWRWSSSCRTAQKLWRRLWR